MQTLLDKIRNNMHWAVLLLLEVVSLVLLFRFNSFHGSIWFTQANAVTGHLLEWKAGVVSYLDLRNENRLLVQHNLTLQHNNDVLRHELQRLQHKESYTERHLLETIDTLESIPAQVISNSIKLRDNVIVINKGSVDGIKPEMGVLSGTGIVGIVSQVSRHYATVMPILNSHSAVSVRLADSEYFGYLQWRGGSCLHAVVTDIPRHARLRVGQQVETSGFSSVFPPGIFVGKVKTIQNSPDGLAYELTITLSTDFACLREVRVIEAHNKAVNLELERK